MSSRYEQALRPEPLRWPDWVKGQMRKIDSGLDWLEGNIGLLGNAGAAHVDVAQVAAGCAFGYLDFRFSQVEWRKTRPGLAAWNAEFAKRASISESVQTVPVVCMHCEQPTCAEVCPADAIKRTGDGVVQSARKPRCIACGNCVVACPFGVPELYEDRKIMMKCDMCYDRTSVGKKPMCATVCPSQALFFGTREQIEQLRPLSTPVNTFQFGHQTITTQVYVMVPRKLATVGAAR